MMYMKPLPQSRMEQLRKTTKIKNIQTHVPDVGNGWQGRQTAFEQDQDGTAVASWSCSTAVYKLV